VTASGAAGADTFPLSVVGVEDGDGDGDGDGRVTFGFAPVNPGVSRGLEFLLIALDLPPILPFVLCELRNESCLAFSPSSLFWVSRPSLSWKHLDIAGQSFINRLAGIATSRASRSGSDGRPSSSQ
jgi:hypothetical protein